MAAARQFGQKRGISLIDGDGALLGTNANPLITSPTTINIAQVIVAQNIDQIRSINVASLLDGNADAWMPSAAGAWDPTLPGVKKVSSAGFYNGYYAPLDTTGAGLDVTGSAKPFRVFDMTNTGSAPFSLSDGVQKLAVAGNILAKDYQGIFGPTDQNFCVTVAQDQNGDPTLKTVNILQAQNGFFYDSQVVNNDITGLLGLVTVSAIVDSAGARITPANRLPVDASVTSSPSSSTTDNYTAAAQDGAPVTFTAKDFTWTVNPTAPASVGLLWDCRLDRSIDGGASWDEISQHTNADGPGTLKSVASKPSSTYRTRCAGFTQGLTPGSLDVPVLAMP